MDPELRTALIMFAITSVVGALAWLFLDMRGDVKTLLVSNASHVSTEQHNALAKNLREEISALKVELGVLKDRSERK